MQIALLYSCDNYYLQLQQHTLYYNWEYFRSSLIKVTGAVLFLFCMTEKTNAEKSIVLLAKMLSNCSFRESRECMHPGLCAASVTPCSISVFPRLEKT